MALPPINHAAVDQAVDLGVPADVIRAAADYQCRYCGATAGVAWDETDGWVPACRHGSGCGKGRGDLYVRVCMCPQCVAQRRDEA